MSNRYIYIPLGGTKNLKFTTVLVFSFVALWHDLSFRLLAWGWLISLFILPEIAARYFLTEKAVSTLLFADVTLLSFVLYSTATSGGIAMYAR